MKRRDFLLLGASFLFFTQGAAAQFSGGCGGGSGFCASGVAAPTYYINSSTGNDSNNGRSLATAWQTVGKVNAAVLVPGDVVAFCGGQSFAATLTVPASGSVLARIVFTSYGIGRATLAPASGNAIDAIDKECLTFDNIDFAPVSGNIFYLSAHTVMRHNVTVQNFTGSSGAGGFIGGDDDTGAWTNVLVQNFVIHNQVHEGLGSYAWHPYLHSNINVLNGVVHDCGTSGVYLGDVTGGTVVGVIAYNNGAAASTQGPVGIWAYESDTIIISSCESYNNVHGSSSDGGGFDLDGGCQNCIIEYCYSHGNDGAGYLLYNYGSLTWNNNTVRFCISENDGSNPSHAYEGVTIDTAGPSCLNAKVYNNAIYNTLASVYAIAVRDGTATGYIANNIIYSAGSSAGILQVTGNNASLLFRGNDYYSTGTFAISWNGVGYASFSAWQAATGQEKISGVNVGLNANPTLVSPGGGTSASYRLLAGSPAIGTGLDLNAQFSINPGSQDFYGNALSNPFSIGAYAGAGV